MITLSRAAVSTLSLDLTAAAAALPVTLPSTGRPLNLRAAAAERERRAPPFRPAAAAGIPHPPKFNRPNNKRNRLDTRSKLHADI